MIDNSLALPGDISGLLRRSSPVIAYSTAPDVVYEVDGSDFDLRHGWVAAWNLELDLYDVTGRAHAARWLATQIGADPSHGTLWRVYGGNAGWALTVGSGAHWFVAEFGGFAMKVPALVGLDPNDSRLLPDGSRWVDAEALRRVCLHVAGL